MPDLQAISRLELRCTPHQGESLKMKKNVYVNKDGELCGFFSVENERFLIMEQLFSLSQEELKGLKKRIESEIKDKSHKHVFNKCECGEVKSE